MYKYAFFDLDGTLSDSLLGITRSVRYALDSYGVTISDEDLLKFIGPPLRESFCKYCGFSLEKSEEAIEKFRERFSTIGITENTLYPGVKELLSTLYDNGIKIVLASSKPEIFAKKILNEHGVDKYFTQIVGALLDGSRDLKTEVMKEAILRLGLTDADMKCSVMVGDRIYDYEGAKAFGMDFIAAGYGYAPKGEMEKLNIEKIANTVPDILKIISEEN